MKKLLKLLISFLFILILIFVGTATYLANTVDPNDLKEHISTTVKEKTNRELTISGDIGWSFFPWLGVKINHIEMGNPPQFDEAVFVSIEELDVTVKLLSLLQGKVEAGTAILKGLKLHLIKNKQGLGNWEHLLQETPTEQSSQEQEAAVGKKIKGFKVSTIAISDAHLIWDDRTNNTHYELEHFNINAENARMNKQFPIEAEFMFKRPNEQKQHKFKLDTQILVDLGRKEKINLSNIKAKFDDSTLEGDFSVNNFDAPEYIFTLLIDKVDLDALQGKSPKKSSIKGQKTASKSEEVLPVSTLRSLNADGKITIKHFHASNLNFSNINIPIQAKNGMINLSPVTAELYGGSTHSNVSINAKTNTPQISLNEKISHVQVGPLLKDMTGKATVTGTANFEMKFTSTGNTHPALRSTMNGNGDFALENGVLHGINIDQLISMGEAFVNKIPLPGLAGPQETQFSKLSGTFTIVNGVIHNNDLLMMSKRVKTTGAGTANLNNEHLNYRLVADRLDKSLVPIGFNIPIDITGTFSNPKISPDYAALTKNLIKGTGEDILERIDEQIPEKIKGIFDF